MPSQAPSQAPRQAPRQASDLFSPAAPHHSARLKDRQIQVRLHGAALLNRTVTLSGLQDKHMRLPFQQSQSREDPLNTWKAPLQRGEQETGSRLPVCAR